MQKHFMTKMTKAWLGLCALGLVFFLAACGDTSPSTSANNPTTAPTSIATTNPTPTEVPTTAPTSSGNSIAISGFAFSPASLTVKAGTKVTWTNSDSVAHTVTDDHGAFGSSHIAPGGTFSFTFTTPGTYTYHCAIHPSMTGTVIVQ